MTREEVKDTLRGIFAKVLNEPMIVINDDMTTNDIEAWDSVTNMTIISEVEDTFCIKLKLREIIKMKNIGALCDTILSKYEDK
ncbi:MAG: acyl carrier protein [Prevotella sp.]|nr:acyl carrier protein [Prevotella sp.]